VAPPVKKALKETLQQWGSNIILVTNDGLSNSEFQKLKRIVFASCDIALAASGTVSLELAATGTPMVIAYDMGFLSRIVFRLLIRVNSVNLVNLISNQIIIPEFIGNNCKPDKISQALLKELDNASMQKTAMQRSVDLLRAGKMSSGAAAANSVLDFLQAHENL
jgi:lipid-A-disaccharide synthase